MPKNRQNQGAADQGKIDWEGMIAERAGAPIGGAPAGRGFQAQTANGTARAEGTGWNKQWDWGMEAPQVPAGGAWKGGRSNRTGE